MKFFTLHTLQEKGVDYILEYIDKGLDADLARMTLDDWFSAPGETAPITPMFGALMLLRQHAITTITRGEDVLNDPAVFLLPEDRTRTERSLTILRAHFSLAQEALAKLSNAHRRLLAEVKAELADVALKSYDAAVAGTEDPQILHLQLKVVSNNALLYRSVKALRAGAR